MSSVVSTSPQKKRKKRSPNITVGTRVSGNVGPLTYPSVAPGDSPTPQKKRRVARIMHGTVISSQNDSHWRVHWDDMLVTGDHKSKQLQILSSTRKNSLSPDTKSVMERAPHIGKHSDVKKYCKDGVPPPPRLLPPLDASTSTTRNNASLSGGDESTIVISTDSRSTNNTLSLGTNESSTMIISTATDTIETIDTSTTSIPSVLMMTSPSPTQTGKLSSACMYIIIFMSLQQ